MQSLIFKFYYKETNMIPTFALLTDFGHDFAVASMEALIYKELPHARVIHVDHSLPKFNILSASFIIDSVYNYFPHGTIFICIVDPGVGSTRKALCLIKDSYVFVGPDNGIFHTIITQVPDKIYEIDTNIIVPSSVTFHGRDLFVPASIRFVQGDTSFLIPRKLHELVKLDVLEKNHTVITYIDSFGNIKTNIPMFSDTISSVVIATSRKTYQVPVASAFSSVPRNTLFVYKGSNNTIEIAVNKGSANKVLHAKAGDVIQILPLSKGTV